MEEAPIRERQVSAKLQLYVNLFCRQKMGLEILIKVALTFASKKNSEIIKKFCINLPLFHWPFF